MDSSNIIWIRFGWWRNTNQWGNLTDVSPGILFMKPWTKIKAWTSNIGLKADPFDEEYKSSGKVPTDVTYYIDDHLGNLRVSYKPELTCSTIPNTPPTVNYNLEGVYDYSAYGRITRSYTHNTDRYLSTQHERDAETGGLEGYDYRGARLYDSDIGVFLSIDPMQKNYPSTSPYAYCLNNPEMYVDPDGRYVLSAEFITKYPLISKFITSNMKDYVMSSPRILEAFYQATPNHYDNSKGNLTQEEVLKAVSNNSGPKVESSDGLYDKGEYWYEKNTIYLSEKRLNFAEKMLGYFGSGDMTADAAYLHLFPVIITLLHETTHYGDWLDQIKQENVEPGDIFEMLAFFEGKNGDISLLDKYSPAELWQYIKKMEQEKDQSEKSSLLHILNKTKGIEYERQKVMDY